MGENSNNKNEKLNGKMFYFDAESAKKDSKSEEENILSKTLIMHMQQNYTNDILEEISAIGVKNTNRENEKNENLDENRVDFNESVIHIKEDDDYEIIEIEKIPNNSNIMDSSSHTIKQIAEEIVESPLSSKADLEKEDFQNKKNSEIETNDNVDACLYKSSRDEKEIKRTQELFRIEDPNKVGEYTGKKILKYVLTDCIADEGQAQIYEVKRYPNKVCKIFKENLVRGNREIEVLVALKDMKHPGIVEIEEIAEIKGKPCFFMKKIHGGNLSQTQVNKNLLTCLLLMWRIADSVAIVHTNGISHRDLKPSNIMLDKYLFPTIIDFGLTKYEESNSVTKGLFGTPRYMAPEQFLGKHCLGEQLDVHAVGIIFYELLCGNWPFGDLDDYNMVSVMKPIVEKEVESIPAQFQISKDLEKICLRCFCKDTKERYISAVPLAAELWQELCRLLYTEVRISKNKEKCLQIAEKIFNPYWLGRNKSIKYWKKFFADFWHVEFHVVPLPQNNTNLSTWSYYKNLKTQVQEKKIFQEVVHTSSEHQAIFQKKPSYTLSEYIQSDGVFTTTDINNFKEQLILGCQAASDLGLFLNISFDFIEYDEKITFALSYISPTKDQIDRLMSAVFSGKIEEKSWLSRNRRNKYAFFNKKDPWQIMQKALFAKNTPVVKKKKKKQKYKDFEFIDSQKFTCGSKTFKVKMYQHELTGLVFSTIPSGSFIMGDLKPHYAQVIRNVNVNLFLLSQTTVTQKVWFDIMKTKPWRKMKHTKEGENFPATCMNWLEAKSFCLKTGLDLPFEIQWEYACRGGTSELYFWGKNEKNIDDYAWYSKNTSHVQQSYPHEVAQKKPNAFGLHDMIGNCWEWCVDDWTSDFSGLADSADKVRRGVGFWYSAKDCSCGYREKIASHIKHPGLSFRVCFNSRKK